MLQLIVERGLSFSAVTAFAFALLMLDPQSSSLVSEAQACDPEVLASCHVNCAYACSSGFIQECLPWESCDCAAYCYAYCQAASGCG